MQPSRITAHTHSRVAMWGMFYRPSTAIVEGHIVRRVTNVEEQEVKGWEPENCTGRVLPSIHYFSYTIQ